MNSPLEETSFYIALLNYQMIINPDLQTKNIMAERIYTRCSILYYGELIETQ